MANTYTQAYFHLVFSPKYRQSLLHRAWRNELEKYITGIVQNRGHKLIAIGAMPDHIDIFIGYNINQSIPELVENIKTSSNQWINANGFTNKKFSWQKGYGAFTHSHAQLKTVAKYVNNQEVHHRAKTFKQEYIAALKEFSISYKKEYLFEFYDL